MANELKTFTVMCNFEDEGLRKKVIAFIKKNEDESSETIDWDVVEDWLDSDEAVWVAIVNNEIVGLCTIGMAENDEYGKECTRNSIILSNVYVAPNRREKGYATALVGYVIKNVTGAFEGVFLTLLDDDLSEFYQKLGFYHVRYNDEVSVCNMAWFPQKHVAYLYVNKQDYKKYNDMLHLVKADLKKLKIKPLSTIVTFNAKFENNFEADIKICSGDNDFFLDPVLFDDNGCEVGLLDTDDSIDSSYSFEYNDEKFEVRIITTDKR